MSRTVLQAFNLTKYFVQVLAGVTNMNVVLDPQGSLFFGSHKRRSRAAELTGWLRDDGLRADPSSRN